MRFSTIMAVVGAVMFSQVSAQNNKTGNKVIQNLNLIASAYTDMDAQISYMHTEEDKLVFINTFQNITDYGHYREMFTQPKEEDEAIQYAIATNGWISVDIVRRFLYLLNTKVSAFSKSQKASIIDCLHLQYRNTVTWLTYSGQFAPLAHNITEAADDFLLTSLNNTLNIFGAEGGSGEYGPVSPIYTQ